MCTQYDVYNSRSEGFLGAQSIRHSRTPNKYSAYSEVCQQSSLPHEDYRVMQYPDCSCETSPRGDALALGGRVTAWSYHHSTVAGIRTCKSAESLLPNLSHTRSTSLLSTNIVHERGGELREHLEALQDYNEGRFAQRTPVEEQRRLRLDVHDLPVASTSTRNTSTELPAQLRAAYSPPVPAFPLHRPSTRTEPFPHHAGLHPSPLAYTSHWKPATEMPTPTIENPLNTTSHPTSGPGIFTEGIFYAFPSPPTHGLGIQWTQPADPLPVQATRAPHSLSITPPPCPSPHSPILTPHSSTSLEIPLLHIPRNPTPPPTPPLRAIHTAPSHHPGSPHPLTPPRDLHNLLHPPPGLKLLFHPHRLDHNPPSIPHHHHQPPAFANAVVPANAISHSLQPVDSILILACTRDCDSDCRTALEARFYV